MRKIVYVNTRPTSFGIDSLNPIKLAFLVLMLTASMLLPISAANADWLQYQASPSDTYNRPDLPPEYDIINLNLAVSDTRPDEYWFFIQFAKPVTANLFATGLNSWAGVFLDVNNDGKVDYSLETNEQPYSGNYTKDAKFTDRTSGAPMISTRCSVKTWTNLGISANWIGFSIKKDCLSFSSIIGLQAYVDHIGNDGGQFDYAPETVWAVSISGGSTASSSSGNTSSSVTSGQLPSMNNKGATSINAPSTPPTDLVQLAAEVTKSVVTVKCGKGVGSGWAIQSDLSSSNSGEGFKSYVITNHHVIEDCLVNRNITLLLSDQREVSAYVYSWDSQNDVAGVLTSTDIPGLNWRGPTPQQGWWVAAIGSPLGFPGILTTGIVSSVNTQTNRGTTNAAINPGNSGGPVFDRQGRVIGLATAKYVNSEGFGIFHGTPLLCGKILTCTAPNQVWSGLLAPSSSDTPKPSPSPTVDSGTGKKTQNIITDLAKRYNLPGTLSISESRGSSVPNTIFAYSDAGLPLEYRSLTESVCHFPIPMTLSLNGAGKCVLEISQRGNSNFEKAAKVVEFSVATKYSSVEAKITLARKSWASWIETYDFVSGANPLQSNKLTTIKVTGMCNGSARTVQAWKNTDDKGKRYPNGSRPTGKPWKCKSSGSFEGNVQVSGGTRFYIVDLPKSHVGTQIEFRVGQEIVGTEYVDYQ